MQAQVVNWWVAVNIPCTNSRADLGPYPTLRLAKKASRKREYRNISVAWFELRSEDGRVVKMLER